MKPITKIFGVTMAAALVLAIVPRAQSRVHKTRNFASTAAFVVDVVPRPQADEKQCSNATLNGAFAFTSTGIITAPMALAGPFAIVGRQIFDGNGATTAAATVSQNGNIIPVTLEGTYTVNSDCTGTFAVEISPVDITTHLFFVIDDHGKEFQVIQTDPHVVVTGTGRRQ